jgi:hypothetical protein
MNEKTEFDKDGKGITKWATIVPLAGSSISQE